MVARFWQGAGVALAAMQLCIGRDFRRVEPRFPADAGLEERAELVIGFIAALPPSWPP